MKKVLLVDDHPLIIEGYKMALENSAEFANILSFTKAFNCKEAKEKIDEAIVSSSHFDLIIVDFSLPSGDDFLWKNGNDIVKYLRTAMPDCMVIMITGHTEVITIYEIIKSVRPNALVSKNEITPSTLVNIIKDVFSGNSYQSPIVKHCLDEMLRTKIMYDDYNRQILVLLSKGHKLVDLENHVPLSGPTIKKRIAKMKKVFDSADTSILIQEAIKQGFV